ncbi:dihydrolipoyllysine-residue acetyltransferase [Pusillimonas sp. NJUB218]|uniref:dihydrolipoyllysine-residue acetyltransferase n=1 Tax=Pusillimonas sp. NJUB218 TaxID=2023230 RepID=UPI000F4CD17E|nr:dihydrolipoyllysine-residue acetyltransferase [Pusillimonas sp. NJUB218]ROT45221.1 dihydrolipoyllysine-residue acetyltransferase [Pusillimonas sp. NJUB218]
MSNLVEVKVPDIGDFNDVEVIEVLVAPGDTIKEEQSLITVESDKASMEIPSTAAGKVKSVKVNVGDKVKEGSLILELEAAEQGAASAPAAKPADDVRATQATAPVAASAAPAAASVPAAASRSVVVEVPDIGDFPEVEIIEVLVAEGDTVAVDQSLITVESDKASMEVPSSHAGVVTAIKVRVGDKVSKGSALIEVKTSGEPVAAASAASQAASASEASDTNNSASLASGASTATSVAVPDQARPAGEPPARPSPTEAYGNDRPLNKLPHASPSVRKFARELGVDLTRVGGSGPKGRIVIDDVRGFVKQALAGGSAPTSSASGSGFSVIDWPKVDFAKFGPIESRPLSRIKKLSGANLSRNWVMIPHVTNNDLADITDLEALRVQLNKENEKSGVKVTMLAFLIKACVAALKKFPEFNASLEGDNLILKQYYHIGFAADTPNGLVVPVIRDADKKGIFDIAAETSELAKQARDGKLSPAQMQGGCFSISSLGGIGGTSFTPIINAPEVAILGVSRSSHQPVWDGSAFQPRLMLPLSLSYDHRVIDGASAARFNAYLGSLLADFRRIAL